MGFRLDFVAAVHGDSFLWLSIDGSLLVKGANKVVCGNTDTNSSI